MADLNDSDYDFELTYAASAKGWMETDIFHNYFEKVLIPSFGEERPALIIYDGHSTHVDARVVELAVRNNVTILKLPPHTSHLLQPLDISVFKSFKAIWDAKLVEWQRRNVGTKMPKNVFSQTMADTWQQTNPEVIKSGFKKAGIYPFNAHVIPIDKYDPDAYQRYKKTLLARTLKQPKSLKEICIESFNNQFAAVNETIEITGNNYVALLSAQSRNNAQMIPFEARHPSQVPACLQNSKPTKSKINIISNHQEETSLQKSRKDRKCVMKMKNDKNITSEKALADKSTNPVCSKKGKGVGKKSKGKENQIDKNEGISYFATGEEDKNEQIAEYPKETQTCKLQPPGTENKELVCGIPEKCPVVRERYDLNDTVLVRCFIRNKWKYYVGFIQNISKHEEQLLFFIDFLKTSRRQQRLSFVEPKKKDTDQVPESLVVKKIELQKKRERDKEYYLTHDEDTIYFD
ncbi:uncharacterized protein LOC124636095 [Helicoverpa zea]|uniref:uncharacterized protein LOC124636095 n=1 Tax=Helicoverpa zea TaxID=7113 RepID=UPI001F56EFEB|nr:uncharacterized protein LOC124636095 [Helicoverpa zea]